MKTIDEIVKQQPVYLNDWKDEGKVTVLGAFFDIYLTERGYLAPSAPYANVDYWVEKKALMDKALDEHKNETILFATYTYEDYSGYAWVLFYDEEKKKLFEVNGSHCSCMGLEGQWEPEETNLEAIEFRLKEGTLGESDNFANELKSFLGV
jgi:hypothetical protein